MTQNQTIMSENHIVHQLDKIVQKFYTFKTNYPITTNILIFETLVASIIGVVKFSDDYLNGQWPFLLIAYVVGVNVILWFNRYYNFVSTTTAINMALCFDIIMGAIAITYNFL